MDHKTIQTYDLLAKEYDEETAPFWELFPRTFVDRFIELTEGKILDVGSGPGRDALILKEGGLDVTCLDASHAMIKLSQEKGFPSLLGDFNDMPFQDESFDGVWAYTSILHVPKTEIEKPLGEIRRVLKPGGTFGLGLIEGETEGYKESSGVSAARWFSFYTKEEVEKLLGENGFEILYFEQFKPKSKNYLNFIAKKL